MAWATHITEHVNQLTGIEARLWAQMFSPGAGTMAWSSFVPDLATLEAASDKMAADNGLAELAAQAAEFTTGALDDQLAQVLTGGADPNQPMEYVTVVRAVCASGHMMRGIELGIEIAQRAEAVTGTPTMFALNSTGVYGGVTWSSPHTSIQAMEAASARMMADTEWNQWIDRETSGVYAEEPFLTSQLIYRRVV
jgi:hypothetical protein